jgi:hypothetical protein
MSDVSRTVIFWGAGATATLGMRTTAQQATFVRVLAEVDTPSPLSERVSAALWPNAVEPWTSALADLLTILGDENKVDSSNSIITENQMEVMRRNWQPGADNDKVRGRIFDLRTLFDWRALKAAVKVCPAATGDGFIITDLFNLLDLHSQSSHGFRDDGDEFLTPQRVVGARNALKMLLQAMFYIDYQQCIEEKGSVLRQHYAFATALGKRMQRQALALAGQKNYESRDFYMGDVSFASLNYDPIALWCQFVANRELNRSTAVPHVDCPAARVQIFHDLGHFVAGTRVEQDAYGAPWHPMNESSAQRLNEPENGTNVRIRISKFLFPHGCLFWRECPDCGKLSAYYGDSWALESPTLIPPPPLKAFVRSGMFRDRGEREKDTWERGEVDARTCVHCHTLTYAHHTATLMQSNFKSVPPPFIEEVQRDLRVAVQNASHIVLMGYSLPPDDVTYRAFFAARRRRDRDGESPVKCSVVVGFKHGRRWLGPSAWPSLLNGMKVGESPRTTLEAARDLFRPENVRFYGGGIPEVFLDDAGDVTEATLERFLTWDAG